METESYYVLAGEFHGIIGIIAILQERREKETQPQECRKIVLAHRNAKDYCV